MYVEPEPANQADNSCKAAAMNNVHRKTVDDFGREWARFDQSEMSEEELDEIFGQYFSIFPWDMLGPDASGMDVGCGTGRWATRVAPRVGELHCIDASDAALEIARQNLTRYSNCRFHLASVDEIPVPEESQDFAYSLGVLHHIPDTLAGLASCVTRLKPGAPILIYLYYAFDNKPMWFKALWRLADAIRRVTSRLPSRIKFAVASAIAAIVYLPLARLARTMEVRGIDVRHMPLSYYRDRSYYTMRTDALDRFGTRLEKRFTAKEIVSMMERSGLENIRLSPDPPFWCALGYRSTGNL